MRLLRCLFLVVLFLSQQHVSGMDHLSVEHLLVNDIPNDIWFQIFGWINQDIEKSLSQAENTNKAVGMFRAIKNILSCTTVCRAMNVAAVDAIVQYLERANNYLELLSGGKDKVLYRALRGRWYRCDYDEKLTRLCCKLGADINSRKFTNGETLLTYAIKKKDEKLFEKMVKFGADLMCPNFRGQVPIDLAEELHYRSELPVLLKDYGGDPEDRYEYKGNHLWKRCGFNGYKKSQYSQVRKTEKLPVEISVKSIN